MRKLKTDFLVLTKETKKVLSSLFCHRKLYSIHWSQHISPQMSHFLSYPQVNVDSRQHPKSAIPQHGLFFFFVTLNTFPSIWNLSLRLYSSYFKIQLKGCPLLPQEDLLDMKDWGRGCVLFCVSYTFLFLPYIVCILLNCNHGLTFPLACSPGHSTVLAHG